MARREVIAMLLATPSCRMTGKPIAESSTSYAQAFLVEAPKRILFVSGQVPADTNGDVPQSFDAQCRLVWHNIAALLAAADMSLSNLVKITTYLSDRRYRAKNTEIRHQLLGPTAPAITVVISELFDEGWLLEIEAVACD